MPASSGSTPRRRAAMLTVRDAPARVAAVVTAATAPGWTLVRRRDQPPDLESVFLHLTGKALRD